VDFKLGLSQLLPEDIKAAQDMKNNANKVDKVTAGRGIGPRRVRWHGTGRLPDTHA
jgi:hypothetical protein